MEVICVGLGRTGTTSLKGALEELGFGPCYDVPDVIGDRHRIAQWSAAAQGRSVDWKYVFAGYRATVFWPAAVFWRELLAYFPEAKVILTVRDSAKWYESALRTIYATMAIARTPQGRLLLFLSTLLNPRIREMRRMMRTAVWSRMFNDRFADRQQAIATFERHNRDVEAHTPSGRLLVYDVAEGWAPLCEFLSVPVPGESFPSVNDNSTFRRNQLRQLVRGMAVPLVAAALIIAVVAVAALAVTAD